MPHASNTSVDVVQPGHIMQSKAANIPTAGSSTAIDTISHAGNIFQHLEAGGGISEWQMKGLLKHCGKCKEYYLAKHSKLHIHLCDGSLEILWCMPMYGMLFNKICRQPVIPYWWFSHGARFLLLFGAITSMWWYMHCYTYTKVITAWLCPNW